MLIIRTEAGTANARAAGRGLLGNKHGDTGEQVSGSAWKRCLSPRPGGLHGVLPSSKGTEKATFP